MPGFMAIVGATEAEVRRTGEELQALIDDATAMRLLARL